MFYFVQNTYSSILIINSITTSTTFINTESYWIARKLIRVYIDYCWSNLTFPIVQAANNPISILLINPNILFCIIAIFIKCLLISKMPLVSIIYKTYAYQFNLVFLVYSIVKSFKVSPKRN